ncbi:MAG: hypothetical protein ACI9FJ_002083 [Alteromonadaceae bacterium]|jgi:hypothetical protein
MTIRQCTHLVYGVISNLMPHQSTAQQATQFGLTINHLTNSVLNTNIWSAQS